MLKGWLIREPCSVSVPVSASVAEAVDVGADAYRLIQNPGGA